MKKILRALKEAVWIEDIWRPEKQQEYDIGMMDAMVTIPEVNESQLKAVNMCRVYLQVIKLSKMDNMQGTEIPPGRMTGQWRRESSLSWPKLPWSPPKVW